MEDVDVFEYSESTGERERSVFGRRKYLELTGAAVVSLTVATTGSGVARAESGGYGEGGYGEGPYGGESTVDISTKGASEVETTSATLNGAVEDLGDASSVECYFDLRESGADSWNSTATQTISSTGSFSTNITGLSSSTGYEFRAVAVAEDGSSDTGSLASFTTHSDSDPPAIDAFDVTEEGSPNPHCRITAEWSVSDVDGDLDTVVVEVFRESGPLAERASTDVSGPTASGTETIDIKHADDQTFEVVVTVSDSLGDSTSRSTKITE